jgi:ribonuclease HI
VKRVQLITDGSCLGNPGRGGWAAILRYGPHRKELFGYSPRTTNNRMELTAAIEGLRALKEGCDVEVVTDSEYLKNGITQWLPGWKRKNFMRTPNEPVKNADLWRELDLENARHKTNWVWTRGHAFHEDNNRADELAQRAAREQISS